MRAEIRLHAELGFSLTRQQRDAERKFKERVRLGRRSRFHTSLFAEFPSTILAKLELGIGRRLALFAFHFRFLPPSPSSGHLIKNFKTQPHV